VAPLRVTRVILCAALVAAFFVPGLADQTYPVCCYDPVHGGVAYMSDNVTGCGGYYLGYVYPDGSCYDTRICCADATGTIGAWTEGRWVVGCGQGAAYTPTGPTCPALTSYYCANWLPFYGGPGPDGFCREYVDWTLPLTTINGDSCYASGGFFQNQGSCVPDPRPGFEGALTPRPPGWVGGPRTCAYNWPGEDKPWNPDCIAVPYACPPGYNDASCTPAPTPTPIPTPPPPSGSCTSPSGACWPVPGMFGTTCNAPNTFSLNPCPVPTPKPTPREGEIAWRPNHTNYSQGPAVTQDRFTTYLLFHTGFCCPGYVPNDWANWERLVLVAYEASTVWSRDPLLYPPPDTHEIGFGSMVWLELQKSWLVVGSRTTWSSWIAWEKSGRTLQNRVRGWFALFRDLHSDPYEVWWDANVPWDENCRERNTCDNSIGPLMPTVLWIDAVNGFLVPQKLWLFVEDNTGSLLGKTGGMVAYTITLDPEITLHKEFIPVFHFKNGATGTVPLTDIALGIGDGTLYGLATAQFDDHGNATCWYLSCTAIDEWVSGDGGRNWSKGWRTWRAPTMKSPGGLDPLPLYVADPAYIRDKFGRIDQGHPSVVSMIAQNDDPTANTWHLYYWIDTQDTLNVSLPRTWGLDPGSAIPRRHPAIGK